MNYNNDISVVIPLYNKEKYIARAIKSILNQEYEPAEVIIVDDGSTDNGGSVPLAFYDDRIRLIRQENRGECGARNRGIHEAIHQYIGFLDADDEWKPDFLRRILELIHRYPGCGIYATSAQIIKPDGSITSPNLSILPAEEFLGLIPNFFKLFQYGYAFNASSIVIPKDVLIKVGEFPQGVKISGDVATWVKIALQYSIAFDSTQAVVYHQEAQNRVGHVYMPMNEMPYINIIQESLSSGRMPEYLREEAFEFMAQKQIFVAKQNIMAHDPTHARQLLSTCKMTKRYRREWLWWWFWATTPAGIPSKIMHLKQKLIGE